MFSTSSAYNTSSSYSILSRVIIIGDEGTGKSSILLRFTHNSFQLVHNMTIGVEFSAKILDVDATRDKKTQVKLQVWDTAGNEAFRAITRSYYKGAAAALLVCDITRRETFVHLQAWLEGLRTHNPNVGVFLVANKSDLESQRRVDRAELETFAKDNGTYGLNGVGGYTEVSAQGGEYLDNVVGVFTAVAQYGFNLAVKKVLEGGLDTQDEIIGLKFGSLTPSPEALLKLVDAVQASRSTTTTGSIAGYIEDRGNESGILGGPYSKLKKLAAAQWVQDNLLQSSQVDVQDEYYKSALFMTEFLRHRAPICEGRVSRHGKVSRLTQVFQRLLYPENGGQAFTSNLVLLNVLKLYFAIGLVEEYKRRRNEFSSNFRFLVSEIFGKVDGKAKAVAVDGIVQALSGNALLEDVEREHSKALGEGDELTELLEFLKTTLCSFSPDLQALAKSLSHLRVEEVLMSFKGVDQL